MKTKLITSEKFAKLISEKYKSPEPVNCPQWHLAGKEAVLSIEFKKD